VIAANLVWLGDQKLSAALSTGGYTVEESSAESAVPAISAPQAPV